MLYGFVWTSTVDTFTTVVVDSCLNLLMCRIPRRSLFPCSAIMGMHPTLIAIVATPFSVDCEYTISVLPIVLSSSQPLFLGVFFIPLAFVLSFFF